MDTLHPETSSLGRQRRPESHLRGTALSQQTSSFLESHSHNSRIENDIFVVCTNTRIFKSLLFSVTLTLLVASMLHHFLDFDVNVVKKILSVRDKQQIGNQLLYELLYQCGSLHDEWKRMNEIFSLNSEHKLLSHILKEMATKPLPHNTGHSSLPIINSHMTCFMKFMIDKSYNEDTLGLHPPYKDTLYHCTLFHWIIQDNKCDTFQPSPLLYHICVQDLIPHTKMLFKRMCQFGVNILGHFRGEYGIAEASRCTVRSLGKWNHLMNINKCGSGKSNVKEECLDMMKPMYQFSKPFHSVPINLINLENADLHRDQDDTLDKMLANSKQYQMHGVVSWIDIASTVQKNDKGTNGLPFPVKQFTLIHAGICDIVELRKKYPWIDSTYKIGYWNWEMDQFPEIWIPGSIDQYDEVWAPSSFCQEVFGQVSKRPVVKIPYAVDMSDLEPIHSNRSLFGIAEDSFVFMIQFDFLSYIDRKNPLGAMDAFVRAFPTPQCRYANDANIRHDCNILLIVKSINVNLNQFGAQEMWMKVKKRYEKYGHIVFMDKHMSRRDSITLKKSIDCYISLHRAEGFGFNIAEAMYLGKPVIATAYSSNMDFMNTANSYLVRYKLVRVIPSPDSRGNDSGIYFSTGKFHWADPDIEHASSLMRHVVQNQHEAKEIIGKQAAQDIRTNNNPQLIGSIIYQRLKFIHRR